MISPDTHTLYLAGPMTGFELWNFPAFDQARGFLRSNDYAVICPAELDRELGFDEYRDDWPAELAEKAARRDAKAVALVDAVAVLSGFTSSRGARVELELARWIGIPIVAAFAPTYELTDSVDLWLEDGTLDDDLREFEGLPAQSRRPYGSDPDTTIDDALRIVGIEPSPSRRRGMLEEAAELVDGERNVSYGDPAADFRRTAGLWSTYLDGKTVLDPHDVAVMMALLKISRLRWTPEKRDSWIDLAGYAACGLSTIPEEWEK